MFYNAELCFVKETFAKCRLHTRLVTLRDIPDSAPLPENSADFGSGDLFWMKEHILRAQENTFYKLSDFFGCCYIFVLLPDIEDTTYFIIGPYLTAEQSVETLLEQAEQVGFSPKLASQLKEYYSGIPYLPEASPAFAMLDAFGELIFKGAENFSLVDIEKEKAMSPSPITILGGQEKDSLEQKRKLMEMRYAHENELIQAVRLGLVSKAEMLLGRFRNFSFEQRLSDPVRNLKNYCIIMNTLLRKAAESGGVHPLYLDSVSSDFAQKIEQLSDVSEIEKLMSEMFRSYCRLVRKHSMKDYSPPVARTIILIDSDLTSDLSLSALARAQGVSASYLSALFRRETGQTLTDYVNSKRVKLAMQLLKTTSLQVQTIAQHCGIFDIHYFSRIFKKYAGKSPKEYRES
ncbi:MAG: AraC family transcriptional regulator [Oscillospiraceae bacterium]|nr:AraC family transcriptional regulator [Oscillospiraceae bacterium]